MKEKIDIYEGKAVEIKVRNLPASHVNLLLGKIKEMGLNIAEIHIRKRRRSENIGEGSS